MDGQKHAGWRGRLKRYANFKSLRFIIAISFILIMVAVYGVTYYALIGKFRDTTQRNMESVSMQVTDGLDRTVRSYIYNVMELSDSVSFQMFMHDETEKGPIGDMLKTLMTSREGIASIALFDPDGSLVAAAPDLPAKSGVDINAQRWFALASKNKSRVFFSEPHVQNLFYGSYPWVVTLSRNVSLYNQADGASSDRILMIDMDVASLYQKTSSFNSQNGYAYIMDQYGNLIVHPDMRLLNYGLAEENTEAALRAVEGNFLSGPEGKEVYTVVRTMPYTGWRIVYKNAAEDLMVPQQEMARFLLTTVIIGIGVIAVVSWMVSALVTRPVKKLEYAMSQVEKGNLDAVVDVRGDTDVERLSLAYNSMIARIKELMGAIVWEQEEKRKNEMRALQMQIQPHFLYNTLESIIWAAERGNNADAVKMTAALSRLFRISLNKGGDTIRVRDELEHVKSYLTIQEMRYKDKLSYEVCATADALNCLTVKLILQPVVENAIYHGLRESEEKGLISIFAWTDEDKLYLAVEDNGVGMDDETIERVFSDGFVSTKGSGIGMKNVNERIRLYYGEEYSLSVTSRKGEGTVVVLILPRIRENGAEE